jgi:hypothetical protein
MGLVLGLHIKISKKKGLHQSAPKSASSGYVQYLGSRPGGATPSVGIASGCCSWHSLRHSLRMQEQVHCLSVG